MMTNSVCLPSADLGFGLEVPSPNRILNFSFKPESLLVGLAMVGRNATWDSARGQQAGISETTPHTRPADQGTLGFWWAPFLPQPLERNQPQPHCPGQK